MGSRKSNASELIPALNARRIVIVASPTSQSLEVAGPFEVFYVANEKLREAGRVRSMPYHVELVSATPSKTITSPSGLSFLAEKPFDEVTGSLDTLIVTGGMDIWTGAGEAGFHRWLRGQSNSVRRICSICTGAFILAEAGLLDSKRVTTHWYYTGQLQKQYPRVNVDPDRIYVRDGKTYTSAGVSTGIDLALALVEDDLGSDIALRVARGLVLYLRRSESQSQFSTALAFHNNVRIPIREMPIWILENLSNALSIEDLARHAAMSPRNFSRVFSDQFGITPARFVEKLRVETALNLLHDSDKSVEQIAFECGFGSSVTMRRALKRESKPLPSRLRTEMGRQLGFQDSHRNQTAQ